MNRYGRLAYDQARQHRPKAFASLTDPTPFFSRLGEEVEERISQLRDELLGERRPGEDLEEYRRRSYQARRQAEEVVLAEVVWLEPEETTEGKDEATLTYRSRLAALSRALSEADRAWTEGAEEPPARR